MKEFILVTSILLLALLFICTIYDLRDREVPMPLTLGCLVGAGGYGLFNGLWSPVLLTIGLILVADLNSRTKRLVFALIFTVFATLFQLDSGLINTVIVGIWLLWELGVMGGADAKLLIALTLLTGNPIILIPIAVMGGIQGVFASLRNQKEIPFVASIFCGSLLFVLYPLI